MYSGPLFIASDHGGYQLKKRLLRYIQNELKLNITDMGPHEYVETDDYPDYAIPLAKQVAESKGRGILICKNGVGVCIAANKVKGIRAGLSYNLMSAETMVLDDDTNIICLPAKLGSDEHHLAMVKRWLETEASQNERHIRRREKVTNLEL